MKGKIRSIVALLAIPILVVALVPLAGAGLAKVASSFDKQEVIRASDPASAALCSYDINVMSVALSNSTSNATIIVNYEFPPAEIKQTRIPTGEDEKFEIFDQIRITGLHNYGEPGEPVLPYRLARILIPPDQMLVSVEVTGQKIMLLDQYIIEPGQVPIPANSDNVTYTPPNPKIYLSENPFPASPYQVLSVQDFRGYKILLVRLIPIEYIPVRGQLSYFGSMQVSVKMAPPPALVPNSLYRAISKDEERVKAMVDNPELLEKYYPLAEEPVSKVLSLPSGQYDMVIITSQALESYWGAYASWKTLSRGTKTKVYTVEAIYADAEYAGDDNQDEIRNFIIDAYGTWQIEYVLLGGDVDTIPVRLLRSNYNNNEDIPSDLYYGGLDGDWNGDGDNTYGEPDVDNVDWYAEVYVGRAPLDNSTHIANFYNKVKDYEEEILAGYRCKVLFLADNEGHGSYKDNIQNQEFPSSGLTITKQYTSPYTVIDEINAGTHIINHYGHGWVWYWDNIIDRPAVDALTNTDYCFCYSMGCHTNAFDNDMAYDGDIEGIGEHFLYTAHGAFAYIGNTREGWFPYSDDFELTFYDALFDKHGVRLGPILQASKEPLADSCDVLTYIYYTLNLLGDPSTPLRICSDLLVRDHPLDDGSLPSDSAFWTSPDICVDAPTSTDYPTYCENPEYDVVNHVYVTVHNIGCLPASSVNVALYWADPSGGISWPGDWNYIGKDTISSIAAAGLATATIDWTPTAIGHRCLLATAETTDDLISTHDVQWDNNVAQRNVVIVDLTKGSSKTEFVLNPLTPQGERDLKITLVKAPAGVTAKLQIPQTVQIGKVEGASLAFVSEPTSRFTLSCVGPSQNGTQVTVTSVSGTGNSTAVVSNFVCDKKEVVSMEINMPGAADTEGEFIVRITEELDGDTIGGVDYILRY